MLIMLELLVGDQTLWELWIYEHYLCAQKTAQKQLISNTMSYLGSKTNKSL
jgi:hypothetical protein